MLPGTLMQHNEFSTFDNHIRKMHTGIIKKALAFPAFINNALIEPPFKAKFHLIFSDIIFD